MLRIVQAKQLNSTSFTFSREEVCFHTLLGTVLAESTVSREFTELQVIQSVPAQTTDVSRMLMPEHSHFISDVLV